MNHKGLWKAALAVCVVGAGLWWLASSGVSLWGTGELPLELNSQRTSAQSSGHPEIDPGFVIVGGVKRPVSDVVKANAHQVNAPRPLPKFGQVEPVAPELNPQTKSVAVALEKQTHPERLSVLAKPTPFDAMAFTADPKTYLETIEPNRVFAPAEPGPGVKRIQPLSPSRQTVESGGEVELAVRAVPEAPITLTSFDLGGFENGLTSITVQADKDGVARVKFIASPGTGGNANVLAASPVTSGQVKYVVFVLPKQTR